MFSRFKGVLCLFFGSLWGSRLKGANGRESQGVQGKCMASRCLHSSIEMSGVGNHDFFKIG